MQGDPRNPTTNVHRLQNTVIGTKARTRKACDGAAKRSRLAKPLGESLGDASTPLRSGTNDKLVKRLHISHI
jgi:hypothetical protein